MSFQAIVPIAGLRSALTRMQWRRGLRAGVAVGIAMVVAKALHGPAGWAALGALNVTTVDNGGPYRTRLNNMLAALLPGALGVLLGTLAGNNLPLALTVTFAFCFVFTLARVLSQPMAAASVFILVCYIVAYGGSTHTFATGLTDALYFLVGGLLAAVLALVFWPLDPFRPAREAVALVYDNLQQLSAAMAAPQLEPAHFSTIVGQSRIRIEAAQAALAATPARMTVRTVRARNLTVLTESADLLLARILRFAELGEQVPQALIAIDRFLQSSLAPIGLALRARPKHLDRAFTPQGSLWIDLHRAERLLQQELEHDSAIDANTRTHFSAALRDTLLNLEIAFEAVHAISTGQESRITSTLSPNPLPSTPLTSPLFKTNALLQTPALWLETLRANLTLRSVMCRHALRLASVVTLDVLLMPLLHVTHGYWLAMTSLIVTRPYAGETVRRSAERVVGTVLGGILAALLTALLPNETALLGVIVLGAACAIAIYAVDYAWYCFFLTPTIVLLTLPHLRDWHLAAIRTGLTGLGAAIAVLAMLLLWPERESLQLPGLLARAAAADAAYLRATLVFWQNSAAATHAETLAAERTILAPARRLCGLAANDAEDTLDHALLEHAIPLNPRRTHTAQLNAAALTFTTYIRRITRTTTTLAAIGPNADSAAANTAQSAEAKAVVIALAHRLDAIATMMTDSRQKGVPQISLLRPESSQPPAQPPAELGSDQLHRLDRQVAILERTTADIANLQKP